MAVLTILKAVGDQPLTKRFEFVDGQFRSEPLKIPKHFDVNQINIDDLVTLSAALRALEAEPSRAAIRGQLKNGIPLENQLRRCRSAIDPFMASPRQWLCIDIDDLALPDQFENPNRNPEAIARYAADQLPEAFQQTDFFWQFSSSMGIKAGIRIHLWYWLSAPITDQEAKAWLSDSRTKVDLALYNPVQLHFTAAPIFDPPGAGPIIQRSGLCEVGNGITRVPVPDGLHDRAEVFGQHRRRNNRTADGTNLEDSRIERDEEGRVTDGREQFLFYKSLDACVELCRGRNLARDIPTIDQITERTWELFEAETDLDDGLWTREDAREKASYRHRDLLEGWKPVGRNETTALVPDVDPYFEINALPIDQANALLDDHLTRFFNSVSDEVPKKMALRVTMGAGKTTRAIEQLKQLLRATPNLHVQFYLPTHDLIEEQLQNLGDVPEGVQVVHMRGRGHEDEEGNTPCQRYDYVRSLEQAGIPVRPNACYRSEQERCEHYDECAYWQQFWQAGEGSIRLFPHAYLKINKTDRIPEPDIVIIDEAFLSAIHQNLTIRPEYLRPAFAHTDHPNLGNRIAEWLRDGEALLDRLRETGITANWLRQVDFREGHEGPAFQSRTNDPGQFNGARERTIRGLEALCQVLADELELEGRNDVERLRYHPQQHQIIIDRLVTTEIPDADHVIILDATADQSILQKLFPDIEFHRVDFEQRAIVTQVFDRTGSNKSWNEAEDNVEDLIRLLQEQTRIGDRVLCVSHKALADDLRGRNLEEGIAIEHFGNLRGIDAYRDHDTIFITGRNQPPQADIDGLARALWWNEEERLDHDEAGLLGAAADQNLPTELRGYLTVDPDDSSGVYVRSFSDPRIEIIHQQIREAETIQAIARLRLVHAERLKHVYLLGNLPIEMPIHRLAEWNDLMLNQAERELIDKGNIPLTPKGWLTMRPDLELNNHRAKDLMRLCGLNKGANLLQATPLMLRLSMWVIEFKQDKNGKPHGRTMKHLFRHVPEPHELQGEEMTAEVPFGEWYNYLANGDPEIEGSGWGPIHIINTYFFDAPASYIKI